VRALVGLPIDSRSTAIKSCVFRIEGTRRAAAATRPMETMRFSSSSCDVIAQCRTRQRLRVCLWPSVVHSSQENPNLCHYLHGHIWRIISRNKCTSIGISVYVAKSHGVSPRLLWLARNTVDDITECVCGIVVHCKLRVVYLTRDVLACALYSRIAGETETIGGSVERSGILSSIEAATSQKSHFSHQPSTRSQNSFTRTNEIDLCVC
jgi:hypothetical protein